MFRRLLIFIVSGLALLAALVFLAPFILPAETIKTEVQRLIEQKTGWRILVDGDVEMALVPSVRLVARNVSVSPPNHEPIIKAEEARFSVGLSALFSKSIDIEEIHLGKPDIVIELRDDGSPVWLAPSSVDAAITPSPSADQTVPSANPAVENDLVNSLVETLQVQKFTIEQATIRYGKTGIAPLEISNLTVSASLPDAKGPLNLAGSANVSGEDIALSGQIPDFKTLLATNQGRVSLTAIYKTATIAANGVIDGGGPDIFDGTLDIKATNLADLSGGALAPGDLAALGTIKAEDGRITLKFDNSNFYDTALKTDLIIDSTGARPLVKGSLGLGILDLDRLRPADASSQTRTAANADANGKAQKTAGEPDLSALGAVDADLAFSAQTIKTGDHGVENLRGRFALSDGVVKLDITDVVAIGGSARASLEADSKQQPLTTYGSVKANNLSLKTLLALAGQDALTKQIEGRIGTDLTFGFQGLNSADVLATINARGSVGISEARIRGLGLAETFNDPAADEVSALSLNATIDGLTKPVNVKGSGNWRGETIRVDATSDVGALISGRAAATKASVALSKVAATFSGNITPSLPIGGELTIKGKSLRSLAQWLGTALPAGPGYNAFDIATGFTASDKVVTLKTLSLALDDVKGSGTASVGLGAKPSVKAEIAFDLLDVNPYIATSSEASGGSGGQTGQSARAPQAGWSRAPIDFSFINAAELDLTARVKTLKVEGMSIGPLALRTTMQGGALHADLTQMTFYGGNGNARVSITNAGAVPAMAVKLTTTAIEAYPFLRDAAKFERIEGGLDFSLDMTTSGKSEAELVQALNGATKFAFNNGAIRGINIAKSMRALTSGALSGWNTAPTEKTDFSAFTASFNVQNGIASNSDLTLVGPLVRVTGEGSVDLPAQTLKYRVNPKIVASLEGQGGAQDLAGFAVPVIIDGNWAKPRIYPDIKGFLEDPAAGLAKLQSLGGGFAKIASSKPAELLKGLGTDPKTGIAGKVGETLQAKTGVDLGTLIQDGKISKEGGVAAAVGAVGALLGGREANAPIVPLAVGEVPVPRARPQPTKGLASPLGSPAAAPVADALQKLIKPKNSGSAATPAAPADPNVSVPETEPQRPADQLIQGLGGLLGSKKN